MLKRSDPKPLIPSEVLEPIKQKDERIKFSDITKKLKKHSSTLIAGLFIVTICIQVAIFCPANVKIFHNIASHCLSLASLMIIILYAYDMLKLFKPDNFLIFKIPIYTEDKNLLDNLVSNILKIHDVERVEIKNYEEPELD
ncbi:putative integral membrane protein [Ehrlichia ruminantium]|uniref:Putative integral membrane protein n=2 Tax=Ehrlichia ruminantium TaxID=779 RepID=A0A161LYR4_EHRRU|nr:putative integral membrane protein [Ehrlichia ruminantium]GAT77301.1 putative integral membrane protein [Ehrlichia ruminantium]GAT78407.1 putative integral membrane protein [Ehrlichia ruminantium]